ADLACAATVLRRAGALDRAAALAEEAVARGGGAEAIRARGEIAKARGDKARALSDYEALAAEVDDPAVRLELCKLYEQQGRSFERGLSGAGGGTGEDEEALAGRQKRLLRKLASPPAPAARSRKKRFATGEVARELFGPEDPARRR